MDILGGKFYTVTKDGDYCMRLADGEKMMGKWEVFFKEERSGRQGSSVFDSESDLREYLEFQKSDIWWTLIRAVRPDGTELPK